MQTENLEKFYKKQAWLYDFTRKFYLFNRQDAVKMLELKKEDKIIDIACGTGLNIPLLLNYVAPENITGIDYSESMLKIARRNYPKVRFIQGDTALPYFYGKFDKALCTYSLSMIDRWKETISSVNNAIKEEGRFVILDFHKWNFAKPVYKLFKKWLSLHGVDPERDPSENLILKFEKLEKKVLNRGYNYIIKAECPVK